VRDPEAWAILALVCALVSITCALIGIVLALPAEQATGPLA